MVSTKKKKIIQIIQKIIIIIKQLDNKKKCFLGTKSAYQNNVTLKAEVISKVVKE